MPINFPDNPSNGDTYTYTVDVKDPQDSSTVVYVRDVLYTYNSNKDTWTGTITTTSRIADVQPADVTSSPPFLNAGEVDAGTEQNPYQLTPGVSATPGGTILSENIITFRNQESGERIQFTDLTSLSAQRFEQFSTFVDSIGGATIELKYHDIPTSTQDGIVYTSLLQTGNTYFTWSVTQQVASPLEESYETLITAEGDDYIVGNKVTLYAGISTGGQSPYTITTYFQRSVDGLTLWSDLTDPNTQDSRYTLTEADQDHFIRGVTRVIDSTTPINQTLLMNSDPSPKKVGGPPRISEVLLVRETQSQTSRFTLQNYVSYITMANVGTGGNTKVIKVIFNLLNSLILYGVLDSSGEVVDVRTTDGGWYLSQQQGNIVTRFPELFDDGQYPDDVLPEGTSMVTVIAAANSLGNSVLTSNRIYPEVQDVVGYPTPSGVGSEMTPDPDPFVLNPSPFNDEVGVLGSNKAQYGFWWNTPTTTITFSPLWDVSATPITQFQGGSASKGVNDFEIIFVDENDNQTTALISTPNDDWSMPVKFSDVGFTPPTKIKNIILKTLQINVQQNGLIGFYDASDNPVIFETRNVGQTRLNTKKSNIITGIENSTYESDEDKSMIYIVSVQSTDSGNKYFLNGVQQPSLLMEPGKYRFIQLDSTNLNHPLRFSTTDNGTHNGGVEYTTGVTTFGTPGITSFTDIVVDTITPNLYYYCTNHSGMGGGAFNPLLIKTATAPSPSPTPTPSPAPAPSPAPSPTPTPSPAPSPTPSPTPAPSPSPAPSPTPSPAPSPTPSPSPGYY